MSLLEKFVKEGIEGGVLTYDCLYDFTLRVDNNLCGEPGNGIHFGNFGVFGVIYMFPLEFVLRYCSFPLLFCIAAIHTQNLHAIGLFLVVCLHLGESFYTPDAP